MAIFQGLGRFAREKKSQEAKAAEDRYVYYATQQAPGVPESVLRQTFQDVVRMSELRRERQGLNEDDPAARQAARRIGREELTEIGERQRQLLAQYPQSRNISIPSTGRSGLGGAFSNVWNDAWPVIVASVAAGLGGAALAGGAAEAGAGAAAFEGAAATGALESNVLGAGLGGTVDSGFFPDLLNTGVNTDFGFIDPSLGTSVLDTQVSALPALDTSSGFLTPGLTEAGLEGGLSLTGFEGAEAEGLISGDNLSSLSRLLLGTNAQGGTRGIADFFGDRGVLGTGLAVAPALAAINYARNQGPFDTSKLTSAYNQIDPESLALPFDLQTARGRENLSSSLTSRGVMGSSFGSQDLASYDLLRHAGRQNILTSGAQAQAGIGGQILDAQVKERLLKNDLYGRALLALSSGLNPPKAAPMPAPAGSGGGTDILRLLSGAGSLYNSIF